MLDIARFFDQFEAPLAERVDVVDEIETVEPAEKPDWAPICRPGVNAWRSAMTNRAAVMVDAEEYFRHLDTAIRKAKRSIMILGWDFDARIRLVHDEAGEHPSLGELLRARVEAEPDLEVRVLVWSIAVLHAPGAPLPLIFGDAWQEHPRITLRLDREHPIYAAHHQKLVVIDDEIAFVGGMDLTIERWDTSRHDPDDPLRKTYAGKAYGPVHDVQAALDGEAARALGDLARQRWRTATGEDLAARPSGADLWPDELAVTFRRESVAIARTAPAWQKEPPVVESARLAVDAILAARRHIYIEAQYLTARYIREALYHVLDREGGPEVVVLLNGTSRGLMERLIMGINSDRVIRYIQRADRDKRLRVYHPVVPCAAGECAVHIHAKLMIVDDRFFRVGSSNLNNRSVGLDTEVDVAIEGSALSTRRAITDVLARLVGEHVEAHPREVTAALEREGSLVGAIEALNVKPRGLRVVPAMNSLGRIRSLWGTWLMDPLRPFEPLNLLRRRRVR